MTVSMSVVQQGALRVAATTGQSRASEKGKARGGSENTPAALARSALAAQTARNGQSFGRLVSGYARDISETVSTGSVQTEPPRVCRRLRLLRGWSHDEANPTLFS